MLFLMGHSVLRDDRRRRLNELVVGGFQIF
jgi:hypothetical protein